MRRIAVATLVFLVVQTAPSFAEIPHAKQARSPVVAARAKAAGSPEDIGKQARERSEAQQAVWDKKMKALSGSICKGC